MLGVKTAELVVTVRLTNADMLTDNRSTAGSAHSCVLLIGDDDNQLVYKAKLRSSLVAPSSTIVVHLLAVRNIIHAKSILLTLAGHPRNKRSSCWWLDINQSINQSTFIDIKTVHS